MDITKKWNGWDSNTNFRWKRNSKYSTLDWQPIDCILVAWPLHAHEDIEPLKIMIPLEQIEFVKDNLRRCYAQERGRRAVEEDVGVVSARGGGRGCSIGCGCS